MNMILSIKGDEGAGMTLSITRLMILYNMKENISNVRTD